MDAPATRTFSSFTPDERRELYETDPDRFKELAAAAIRKACIGSTEARTQKLRQMQWMIEGRLRKQKTPQQRLQEMQMIFYDGLYGNDGLLFQMNSACRTLAEAFEKPAAGGGKPTLRVVEKRGTLSPSVTVAAASPPVILPSCPPQPSTPSATPPARCKN